MTDEPQTQDAPEAPQETPEDPQEETQTSDQPTDESPHDDGAVNPATHVEEVVQEFVDDFNKVWNEVGKPAEFVVNEVRDIVDHFNHKGVNLTPHGHALGWKKDDPDDRDHQYDHEAEPTQANPSGGLTPAQLPLIWNQLNIGSCTAHGTLRAFVASLIKQGATLPTTSQAVPGQGNPAPFSRLQQYYNSRLIEGNTATDSGAQVRDAIKALVQYGVAPETLWPYNTSQFAIAPPANAVQLALSNEATQYESLTPNGQVGGPESVALSNGKVVIFGFQVPAYFEEPDGGISWDPTSGTPLPVPPSGYSNWLGGHCVAITYYNYSDSPVSGPFGFTVPPHSVVIDNSWDTNWGLGGRFVMDAGWLTSEYASDFWVIDQAS